MDDARALLEPEVMLTKRELVARVRQACPGRALIALAASPAAAGATCAVVSVGVVLGRNAGRTTEAAALVGTALAAAAALASFPVRFMGATARRLLDDGTVIATRSS